MELAIDGILMTLLVGTVASLFIASFLFLFLHKHLRVPAIDRLFRIVMYEDGRYDRQPAERPTRDNAETVFTGLLLIATLFGLGIGAEYASEEVNNKEFWLRKVINVPSDKETRYDSLLKVTASEVRSGRERPAISAMLTDEGACQAAMGNDRDPTSPCRVLQNRLEDFYYTAKNAVFTIETYYQELSELQGRIDFMRSLAYAFWTLGAMLAMGAVAAFLAEIIDFVLHRRKHAGPMTRWWLRQVHGDDSFVGHIKNLSALRLFILALFSAGFGWFALANWQIVERSYDSRVFGYYICPGCLAGEDAGLKKGTIPLSPYRIVQAPALRFEPSAIAFLQLSETGQPLLLIANDKNLRSPLGLYELGAGDTLIHKKDLPLPAAVPGLKVEALSLVPGDRRQRAAYLAGTVRNDGKDAPIVVALGIEIPADPQATAIVSGRVIGSGAGLCRPLGSDSCEIEGMAAPPGGGLILGMRSIGARPRPGLHLVQFAPPAAPRLLASRPFPTKPKAPKCTVADANSVAYGLSDLVIDGPDLLILASFESQPCRSLPPADAGEKPKPPPPIAMVSGAVWRLPLATLAAKDRLALWQAQPLTRFAHKPEGIALSPIDPNAAIIVYDDDARRKSRAFAPLTFALTQAEAAYSIVRLPTELTPPAGKQPGGR